jgi:beta-phosphoglucomutase-like phosphatase (HAD superfamily)
LPIATLFDFDGVLVDSEPVHLAAFNDVLAPLALAISEGDYLSEYFSLDDAGVFQAVLRRAGSAPSEEDVRRLVGAKAPRFMARFADAFRVFPGADALVARRASRGPVGIVSGALRGEIEFALERMGVRALVSFIVSAEATPESKPHPAPYRLALAELERSGHRGASLAIEDSVGGIASARGAGLRCIGVAHTFGKEALSKAGADAVASRLEELTDALLDGTASLCGPPRGGAADVPSASPGRG